MYNPSIVDYDIVVTQTLKHLLEMFLLFLWVLVGHQKVVYIAKV